jgi:hypothetical protein
MREPFCRLACPCGRCSLVDRLFARSSRLWGGQRQWTICFPLASASFPALPSSLLPALPCCSALLPALLSALCCRLPLRFELSLPLNHGARQGETERGQGGLDHANLV